MTAEASRVLRPGRRLVFGAAFLTAAACLGGTVLAAASSDAQTADDIATLLQATRAVISQHQPEINDPARGDKGLSGEEILKESVAKFTAMTGRAPNTIDPAGREGKLLRAEMDAIVAVVDQNQTTINAKGVGFKGFIPAVYARLVSENFSKRVAGEAHIKVTAPPNLVRNLRARPDAWERQVIADRFEKPDWPRGKSFSQETTVDGTPSFRVAVPEYYSRSCLSCHGSPKGSLDITGYPREGAKEGDLGGVISITLTR